MKETDASITVVLPDMFVSFLAQKPNLNKYYETARMESEAWLTRYGSWLLVLCIMVMLIYVDCACSMKSSTED